MRNRWAARLSTGLARYFGSLFLIVGMASSMASDDSPRIGDCVLFREGGDGLLITTPVYWLRGTIAALSPEKRLAVLCPRFNKPTVAYTLADWQQVAAATPCVERAEDSRVVDVLRVQVRVEEWETPWAPAHGTTGWLFRGHFLAEPLSKGKVIDMDATWLQRCELRR